MRYYIQRLIHNTNYTFFSEVISPKPVITDRELLLHYTIYYYHPQPPSLGIPCTG